MESTKRPSAQALVCECPEEGRACFRTFDDWQSQIAQASLGDNALREVQPYERSASGFTPTKLLILTKLHQNRGALRGTSEALAHSPSQMPLSCPVAPPSQRELHKDRAAAVVAWRGGRAPPGPRNPSPVPRPVERPPQRPAPRRSRARPSRVDRRCHWACRTNKGFGRPKSAQR